MTTIWLDPQELAEAGGLLQNVSAQLAELGSGVAASCCCQTPDAITALVQTELSSVQTIVSDAAANYASNGSDVLQRGQLITTDQSLGSAVSSGFGASGTVAVGGGAIPDGFQGLVSSGSPDTVTIGGGVPDGLQGLVSSGSADTVTIGGGVPAGLQGLVSSGSADTVTIGGGVDPADESLIPGTPAYAAHVQAMQGYAQLAGIEAQAGNGGAAQSLIDSNANLTASWQGLPGLTAQYVGGELTYTGEGGSSTDLSDFIRDSNGNWVKR